MERKIGIDETDFLRVMIGLKRHNPPIIKCEDGNYLFSQMVDWYVEGGGDLEELYNAFMKDAHAEVDEVLNRIKATA